MTTPDSTNQPARTWPNEFFACNPAQDNLLAVREGVSTDDALEKASCFLASAIDIATHNAVEEDSDRAWGVVYLMEMAKGIVDGCVGAVPAKEV